MERSNLRHWWWGERDRAHAGVNPSDQTAHQVKNMVYWEMSMPKEKTDERKSS